MGKPSSPPRSARERRGWKDPCSRLAGACLTNPAISVIVPTRNRAENLSGALSALLAQRGFSDYEIIPVDNGSTDSTWNCLTQFALRDARVHPVHEARPGISFARNAVIERARAQYVAFTDDDVRVEPQWVESIVRSFDQYRDADAIGGKVLPLWPSHPPAWLDRSAWGPLALVDYGDAPLRVDRDRPLCLIGANVAMRKAAFADVGLFSPAFPRGQDQEWLERLYRLGGHGMYVPGISIASPVDTDRMTKRYHRKWHYGRGRFLARMRLALLEATRIGRPLDVPGHVWRSLLSESASTIRAAVQGRQAEAFTHECAAWCRLGFVRERLQSRLQMLLRGVSSMVRDQPGSERRSTARSV
jgi:glucosyl-dolichyl phosphate glucuronosyltransferase